MDANQKNNTAIGISTMVIPVTVTVTGQKLADYFSGMNLLTRSPMDSSKYFEFVSKSVSKEPNAILNPYFFQIDQLKFESGVDLVAPVRLFNGARIKVDKVGKAMAASDNADIQTTYPLVFSIKNIWFFDNPDAGLGYFCIPFHWQATDPEALLDALAATSFFRFTKGKKNVFFPQEEGFEAMSVVDMLEGLFPDLLKTSTGSNNQAESKIPSLKIISNKPSLLHILHWKAGIDMQHRHRQAYQVLRVAKRQEMGAENTPLDQSNTDFISSILLDNSIGIYLMNEGALALDTNEEVPALWNKYFPTFLLAINQRQLLIHLIARIMESNIKVPILSKGDLKTDHKQDKLQQMHEAERTIEHLHTTIIQLQLKQIFYTVAHTDELNLLLLRLQERFRISELLQDIKESVGELHQILEAISDYDNWLREKKRELAINLAGLLIGALGGISTLEDILDNNGASVLQHNISYVVVAVITIALGFYFVRKGRMDA